MLKYVSITHSLSLSSNILFYVYTIFIYQFISWWILRLFLFWASMNNTSMNTHIKVFVWIYVFIFPLGYIPRIGIAGSYANSLLNFFSELHNCFSKVISFYISPPNKMRVQISQHLCQHLLLSLFWRFYRVWNGFDLHFTNVQHLFLCLLAICISSWEIYLFK